MTNEKDFLEYVKSKVKFEGDKCTVECSFAECSFVADEDYYCILFYSYISYKMLRCDDCKKYFND